MKLRQPTFQAATPDMQAIDHLIVLVCEADGKVLKSFHIVPPKLTSSIDKLHVELDLEP